MAGDAVGLRASIAINASPSFSMGDDYDKIISFKELHKGLVKSQRNVMWKDSVAGYSINSLKNTYRLRQSLLNEKYKIDPYQQFTIHEPKERDILATRIKDRQFQRSMCDNALYPQMTRTFIRDNSACQVGRGVDDSLDRLETHLRRYYRKYGSKGWVLRCDVKQFFAQTRHEDAKAAIAKRVLDPEVRRRAFDIIDSFSEGERGIALGSQVSQIVEMTLLDEMDHMVKERLLIKYYVRYADDFLLVHPDREYLEMCLKEIRTHLAELGLELNKKTYIHPISQGIKFLKWRFILTESGRVIRRMDDNAIRRERQKLRKLKKKIDQGLATIEAARENFNAWRANADRGDTEGVVTKMSAYYKKLFGEVPK